MLVFCPFVCCCSPVHVFAVFLRCCVVCQFVCLFACLFACFCLFVCLFVCSVCLFVCLFVVVCQLLCCLFACLSIDAVSFCGLLACLHEIDDFYFNNAKQTNKHTSNTTANKEHERQTRTHKQASKPQKETASILKQANKQTN